MCFFLFICFLLPMASEGYWRSLRCAMNPRDNKRGKSALDVPTSSSNLLGGRAAATRSQLGLSEKATLDSRCVWLFLICPFQCWRGIVSAILSRMKIYMFQHVPTYPRESNMAMENKLIIFLLKPPFRNRINKDK